jgi:DNA gyrase/topoisomerase IV subunit A
MRKIESSPYINHEAKEFALYVMQSRAIPNVTDGMKAGGRRVLWTARNGEKWKTANLAGSTMPIHPHASPESAINTLTAPYGNNIPLFTGYGAFGTLLEPTEYGAARYTSVKISKFTQDVIFRDIEIIPMVDNYDGTLQEPVHFLPLIPIVMLNPTSGIAVGFATNVLPRDLKDIINIQLDVLRGKDSTGELTPMFYPLSNKSHKSVMTDRGLAYYFDGLYNTINATTITITSLPYGQTHEKVIAKLDAELDKGTIVDYTDGSKDIISIEVKFKKGILRDMSTEEVLQLLGLTVRHIENLNVLEFTGKAVWNADPIDLVQKYTSWRLSFYKNRYERLRDLLLVEYQKYLDIKCAIDNNIGGYAKKAQSRAELKELLGDFGITYIDYIADLPIYRFTESEYKKNEERIQESEKLLAHYEDLLNSEEKRKKIYISELQEILTNHTKGHYK